jgi:hypothetical protein
MGFSPLHTKSSHLFQRKHAVTVIVTASAEFEKPARDKWQAETMTIRETCLRDIAKYFEMTHTPESDLVSEMYSVGTLKFEAANSSKTPVALSTNYKASYLQKKNIYIYI